MEQENNESQNKSGFAEDGTYKVVMSSEDTSEGEEIQEDITRVNLQEQETDAEETQSEDQEQNEGQPEAEAQDSAELGNEEQEEDQSGQEENATVERIVDEEQGQEESSTEEQGQEAAAEVQGIAEEDQQLLDKVKNIEGIQKVVDFLSDTGGTIEDFIRVNYDYSQLDDSVKIKEYYKQTKPHLDASEIDFLLEDNFSFDEDVDEDRDVKRKKLLFKEEVVKADKFLNELKDKYASEVKAKANLTEEQQKALDFYEKNKNLQQESAVVLEQRGEAFDKRTQELFSKDFKGFEIKVGEDKFRYNINNPEAVAKEQSDLSQFFKTFLDENNTLKDAAGFHRAFFAARNIDKIATHFYEQGKADQLKNISKGDKNIDMSGRPTRNDFNDASGYKVRAVNPDSNGSRLKIRSLNK